MFKIRNKIAILNYDYGDNWFILLKLIVQEDLDFPLNAPYLADFGYIDGSGDGIIEDIGGIDELNEQRTEFIKKRNLSR